MRYVRALDGLRGVAVLLVIMLHFGYVNVGWVGVQFFFVLSGYLITQILLADRDRPFGAYLRRFYTRRVLRIFPLYYGYLLALAAAGAVGGAPELFGRYAPWLFTYTYNYTRLASDWGHSPFITHFWSLAVEEQFYLVWPFVVYVLPPRALRALVLTVLAAAPLGRLWLGAYLGGHGHDPAAAGDALYWFTPCQIDAFAAGAAIPVLGLTERWAGRTRLVRGLALFWLAAGLAQWFFLRAAGTRLPPTSLGFACPLQANFQHVWGYTLLNVAAAACILLLLRRDPWVRPMEAEGLVAVGRISYGMYVLHWPVLAAFQAALSWEIRSPRGLAIFALYLVTLYGVCWVSYRGFESRFLAWKDRWAR